MKKCGITSTELKLVARLIGLPDTKSLFLLHGFLAEKKSLGKNLLPFIIVGEYRFLTPSKLRSIWSVGNFFLLTRSLSAARI